MRISLTVRASFARPAPDGPIECSLALVLADGTVLDEGPATPVQVGDTLSFGTVLVEVPSPVQHAVQHAAVPPPAPASAPASRLSGTPGVRPGVPK